MLRVKRGRQAAFSTVNYNAAEKGAEVPKVENLNDDQALEMITASEGVTVNEKERVGKWSDWESFEFARKTWD